MKPFARWNVMVPSAFALTLGVPAVAAADDDDPVTETVPPTRTGPVQPRQQVEVEVHEAQPPAGYQPAARPMYAQPAPQAAEAESVTGYGGPSRGMLFTGIGLFGVSYGAAAIAAASSDVDEDKRMYVPIAGPWMALVDRPSCTDCNQENTDKVLIVTDGVFQGIGALLVVGSFLYPEKRTRTEVRGAALRPKVGITPMTGRDRLGLAAVGTF